MALNVREQRAKSQTQKSVAIHRLWRLATLITVTNFPQRHIVNGKLWEMDKSGNRTVKKNSADAANGQNRNLRVMKPISRQETNLAGKKMIKKNKYHLLIQATEPRLFFLYPFALHCHGKRFPVGKWHRQ